MAICRAFQWDSLLHVSLETETTVPSDPRSVFDTLTTPSDQLYVQNMVRPSMMDRQKEERIGEEDV